MHKKAAVHKQRERRAVIEYSIGEGLHDPLPPWWAVQIDPWPGPCSLLKVCHASESVMSGGRLQGNCASSANA
jgi:hypothetical protein